MDTSPAVALPRRVPLASARLALPIATFAAVQALAAFAVVPARAAAEVSYLGLLTVSVLLCVGGLAARPAIELGIGGSLATLVIWALPPGSVQSSVLGLLLVATFFAAAIRRLARESTGAARLDLPLAVPLALGAQVLLRGDRLLSPHLDPGLLVSLVGLPLAGAAAAVLLAREHGRNATLLALAVILALAPGFNVASTLALAALAAGAVLGRRQAPVGARVAAVLVLAAPLAWEPRAAIVAAGAALVLAGWESGEGAERGPRRAWPWWIAGIATTLVVALFTPVESWSTTLGRLAWVPLLLPALPLAGVRRGGLLLVGAGLLLAVAATREVPGAAALAAPIGLLALMLPVSGASGLLGRLWSGLLLAGTSLLASYPWLHRQPLADALGWLGIQPGWRAALVVVATFSGALALLARAAARRGAAAWVTVAGGLLVAVAIVASLPLPSRTLVADAEIVLDQRWPERRMVLSPPAAVSSMIVDSSLVNAAALPGGTLVATVRLTDATGEVHTWALRNGEETGEWAARRPDVAAMPGFSSPPPWVSSVEAAGFFAQRYRAARRFPHPFTAGEVDIELAPGLPPGVALVLSRAELGS